jgi:hypothetical protein
MPGDDFSRRAKANQLKYKRSGPSLRKIEGVYGINDGEQELRHLLVVSLRRQLKTGFGRLQCVCEACKKVS